MLTRQGSLHPSPTYMLRTLTGGLLLIAAASAAATGPTGVVWFGRADVPSAAYSPLLSALRAEVPNLVITAAGTDPAAAVLALREKHNATTVVVVSHSMEAEAGVAAQAFTAARAADLKIDKLVLLAGFLQRNARPGLAGCASLAKVGPTRSLHHPLGYLKDGAHDCSHEAGGVAFSVPVLTVGGEIDGVVRVGRLAEAAYTQRNNSGAFPVVVVENMTHSALLANGTFVAGDVPASAAAGCDAAAARASVAAAFGAFLRGEDEVLAGLRAKTGALVAPLVAAFVEQEGSWWFTAGTDDEHGQSPWAAAAQRKMAAPLPAGWQWASNDYHSSSSNAFHLLSDEDKIPPYYRGKHRADVEIVSAVNKTLRSSTVAQLRYVEVSVTQAGVGLNGNAIIREEKCHVLADSQKKTKSTAATAAAAGGFLGGVGGGDVGKAYVSAIEIGTKMASRQLVFNKTSEADGGPPAPDSLDDGDRCAAINKQAYEWALGVASPAARQRHEQHGVAMRMVKDEQPFPPAGPWWIWNYLQYKGNSDNRTLDVASWYAFYSTSGLAYGAGNHYCKLLSPARAMEWIYTDSLK